jgi:preprotein translocase subunit SecA
MNRQRKVIYEQRKKGLRGDNLWADIEDMVEEIVDDLLSSFVDEKGNKDDFNLKGLEDSLLKQFNLKFDLVNSDKAGFGQQSSLREFIIQGVQKLLRDKEKDFGKELTDYLIKAIMLQSIDVQWKDHLLAMDHLREGISLRGYAQKDPVREYQREGYEMFMEMISRIKMDVLEKLCLIRIQKEEEVEAIRQKQKQDYVMSRGEDTPANKTVKHEGEKVGRNDPCPCGSGKKYKKCCGA